MPVDYISKQEISNVRLTLNATLPHNKAFQCHKVQHPMQPPTETSLLETLLHRLELRPTSRLTKWQQGLVPVEADATALEDSKAAVGVLLSTIACPRRPSLRCNRQMPRQSPQTARMTAVRPALVRGRLRQMPFQHAKTVALPSHHSGEGTMPATSSATHVVRRPNW